MMRTAYYPPPGPPSDSRPPGTGRSTSMVAAALISAGIEVSTVPDPDSPGDDLAPGNSAQRRRPDERRVTRLVDHFLRGSGGRPDLWITEGLSAAAPDWIGPRVSSELGIPYVVAAPALPPASAGEPAAADLDALRSALARADAVITTTSATAEAVGPLLAEGCRLIHLPPFLDVVPFVDAGRMRDTHRSSRASHLQLPLGSPWLLAIATMDGDEALESYRVLARALSRFPDLDWILIVVGDGAVRGEVHAALGVLPRHRVRLCDSVAPAERVALLVCCDLFLWPAVGDLGLEAILEAQAGGLPVVACAGPGVNDRVVDGRTGRLAAAGNPESFANAVSFLLRNPAFRASMAEQAQATAMADHDIHVVARALGNQLRELARKA